MHTVIHTLYTTIWLWLEALLDAGPEGIHSSDLYSSVWERIPLWYCPWKEEILSVVWSWVWHTIALFWRKPEIQRLLLIFGSLKIVTFVINLHIFLNRGCYCIAKTFCSSIIYINNYIMKCVQGHTLFSNPIIFFSQKSNYVTFYWISLLICWQTLDQSCKCQHFLTYHTWSVQD